MAFLRFVSIRGWPKKVYSDPGTQLQGANKEINNAAAEKGLKHGLEWVVGPPDSPWYQGAVESLIRTAKRALDFAVHNQVIGTRITNSMYRGC